MPTWLWPGISLNIHGRVLPGVQPGAATVMDGLLAKWPDPIVVKTVVGPPAWE
jgi:hypothetical protein